jgi:putative redox protein
MYAERKGLALRSVEVRLNHERVSSKGCEAGQTKEVMVEEITSKIYLEGDLNETVRNRLLEIATRCPVHKTLSSSLKIRSELTDAIDL